MGRLVPSAFNWKVQFKFGTTAIVLSEVQEPPWIDAIFLEAFIEVVAVQSCD